MPQRLHLDVPGRGLGSDPSAPLALVQQADRGRVSQNLDAFEADFDTRLQDDSVPIMLRLSLTRLTRFRSKPSSRSPNSKAITSMPIPMTMTERQRPKPRSQAPSIAASTQPNIGDLWFPRRAATVSADHRTKRQVGFGPPNAGAGTNFTSPVKRTWRTSYVVQVQRPDLESMTRSVEGMKFRNEFRTFRGQCNFSVEANKWAAQVAAGLVKPRSRSSDGVTIGVPVTPELPALYIGEDDVPISDREPGSPVDQPVEDVVKVMDTSDRITEESLAYFAAEQAKVDKVNLEATESGPIIIAQDAPEPPIMEEKEDVDALNMDPSIIHAEEDMLNLTLPPSWSSAPA